LDKFLRMKSAMHTRILDLISAEGSPSTSSGTGQMAKVGEKLEVKRDKCNRGENYRDRKGAYFKL